MNVLRSKAEQVADILRAAMARGELHEPLPTVREWSSQWAVSVTTCQAALDILKREGWLRSRPGKGFSLGRAPIRHERNLLHLPVVHWLTPDKKPDFATPEMIGLLSQILARHHIGLRVDVVDARRVEAIQRGGARPHEELLVLANFSSSWQSRFTDFPNVLQIGMPIPGIRLPYLTVDLFPALRHAVFGLLRRGFTRISLLHGGSPVLGREFRQICAQAPHPIHGDTIAMREDHGTPEEALAIQRLVERIRGRHGFVTVMPKLAGLLPMTLLKNGLKVPDEVEVVVFYCTPTQAEMLPGVTHYPFPVEQICKTICHAAMRCFNTGAMPDLHAGIPITPMSHS